jgi:REP element-mobilizing transposase RayT
MTWTRTEWTIFCSCPEHVHPWIEVRPNHGDRGRVLAYAQAGALRAKGHPARVKRRDVVTSEWRDA